jgi:hypothetical protein
MGMDTIEKIQLCVLFLLVLAMRIFFSKKLYFHLEFLKMHDKQFKELSLLDVFINPLLFLEVFYIFIPVFIKSERRKEGWELYLKKNQQRLSSFLVVACINRRSACGD